MGFGNLMNFIVGCAYVVQVEISDLSQAMTVLYREALQPVQIFLYQRGFYREVGK